MVLASVDLPDTLGLISARNYLVQYTVVIAVGVMSVAMVLATRPR